MRCTLILAAALLLVDGCVELTDLREDKPPPPKPPGQVDTGWVADADEPDLPPAPSCTDAVDCEAWLADIACRLPACVDGTCEAPPMKDGTQCTDGDFKTRGDRCSAGFCAPGPEVCVCSSDGDCDDFDDGNQCNGRLDCDGCGCAPVETPTGTPCDDANPATVDDVCVSESTCRGAIPCQCDVAADCGNQACVELVCSSCQCLKFPAVAGLIYREDTFTAGLPGDWSTTSDNPAVGWAEDGSGALRATGTDGTYDHGAATCELTSAPVVLPPGDAIVRLEIGLLSAEDGCDDRVEVRVAGELLDTICGPTPLSTRSYSVTGDTLGVLSVRFITDDESNAGGGAQLDHVRWIRTSPDACAPPAETVAPASTAGAQRAPGIGRAGPAGGWRVVWSQDGLWSRTIDAGGLAGGDDLLVDDQGDNGVVFDGWVAWERPAKGQILILEPGSDTPGILPDPEPLRSPALAAEPAAGAMVAYLADHPDGTVLRLWAPGDAAGQALSEPSDGLTGPAIVSTSQGPWVAWSGPEGVFRRSPAGAVGQLSTSPVAGRPAITVGHSAGVVVAWADGEAVEVVGGDAPLVIEAEGAFEPSITPFAGGWYVAWTALSPSGADSGVSAAVLTADLSIATPVSEVAQYVFDDQDGIRLARATAAEDGVMAVWRTAWFDGDESGVVFRRLTFGPDK